MMPFVLQQADIYCIFEDYFDAQVYRIIPTPSLISASHMRISLVPNPLVCLDNRLAPYLRTVAVDIAQVVQCKSRIAMMQYHMPMALHRRLENQ